jgi:hypothetical protein
LPQGKNRAVLSVNGLNRQKILSSDGAIGGYYRVPRIKVESLSEGMTVAADVKNIDGMLLIPSGCELKVRQINILQAWGVAEVEIESTAASEAASDPFAKIPPELVASMTAELKALFWQPDETSPVYNEILRLMLLRRAKALTAK